MWLRPALTAVNVPVCAVVCPYVLDPQQWIAPVLRNPQLCSPPALTAVNAPVSVEVSVWSLLLSPQHEIAPALFSAQVCALPAHKAVNVPVGAVVRLWALLPQQSIVPVLRSAQVCKLPPLTTVYVVGVGVGVGVVVSPSSTPLETSRTAPLVGGGEIVSSGRSSRRPQQLVLIGLSAQEWRVPALIAR